MLEHIAGSWLAKPSRLSPASEHRKDMRREKEMPYRRGLLLPVLSSIVPSKLILSDTTNATVLSQGFAILSYMSTTHQRIYLLLSTLGIAAAGYALFFLGRASFLTNRDAVLAYRQVFFSLLITVVCMESRILISGKRFSRTKLFYFHLACAVPFFVMILFLSFWKVTLALQILVFIFAMGTVTSALFLFSNRTKVTLSPN
jgi:hypothetical protein